MTCAPMTFPDGSTGIICTSGHRKCACGNRATLECDWKVEGRKSGTCDKALCNRCTHSPAPEKDLCPAHAAEWRTRLALRHAKAGGEQAEL